MKFLVIGLGNLGRAIAENLTRIGDEVIGVDLNLHKVEAVKQIDLRSPSASIRLTGMH